MPMPTEAQVLKHNFNKRWHEKYEHTIAAKIEAFHFCKKKSMNKLKEREAYMEKIKNEMSARQKKKIKLTSL